MWVILRNAYEKPSWQLSSARLFCLFFHSCPTLRYPLNHQYFYLVTKLNDTTMGGSTNTDTFSWSMLQTRLIWIRSLPPRYCICRGLRISNSLTYLLGFCWYIFSSTKLEDAKKNSEKLIDTLRAVLEETDIRVADLKKEAYEFKRDIVVGAENTRTGNTLAEKVNGFIACCGFRSLSELTVGITTQLSLLGNARLFTTCSTYPLLVLLLHGCWYFAACYPSIDLGYRKIWVRGVSHDHDFRKDQARSVCCWMRTKLVYQLVRSYDTFSTNYTTVLRFTTGPQTCSSIEM